jgi:myxalamid-type polyketide synthase MxaB
MIDWVGFEQDYARRKLILPTYPWQRERYWLDRRGRNGKTAMTVAPSRPLAPSQEHPLLGQRLPSALKQALFVSQLSPDSPPYLADHRVFGTAILPAAAYMEIALAAGSAYFKAETLLLEDMLIQQALILPDKVPTGHEKEQTVQLILTPEGSQLASFQIFSLTQCQSGVCRSKAQRTD